MDKVNKVNAASMQLALNIDRLMRRIHADLHPLAPEFDRQKVGPLGGMVLLTIGEREPVEIQALVDALGRDKSQMSRLLQRFERQGLVQREASRRDGRVSLVSLTAAGREQLQQIQHALSTVVETIFNDLSEEERGAFADILARVLEAPERYG